MSCIKNETRESTIKYVLNLYASNVYLTDMLQY